MPGEKPIPLETLPKGTYPEWKSDEVYHQGDRVMIGDQVFEAKWWTEKEDPQSASLADPGFSWRPLSQEEIRELLKEE